MLNSFEEYFKRCTENQPKTNGNYLGILKKEYPRWEGWKVTQTSKEEDIDILVRTFIILSI